MQEYSSPSDNRARTFRVGIVGASSDALAVFKRIFDLTSQRVRAYEAIEVKSVSAYKSGDVDIVLLCSSNPLVVSRWRGLVENGSICTPLVRLSKGKSEISGEHIVTIPLNPNKLVRTLDDCTIKELQFFPEFQIGNDDSRVSGRTLAGIRMLKSTKREPKFPGLRRALVVDDSLPVRKQIEVEFSLLGVEVDLAESAEEALLRLNEVNYDVIFLDVIMPGMDGYAACKRIRTKPNYQATPLVLLTSRSSSFDKLKGALSGCDTYLVKPINHNDFETVLKKHFKQQGELP